jgi:hypothetical protein
MTLDEIRALLGDDLTEQAIAAGAAAPPPARDVLDAIALLIAPIPGQPRTDAA